MGGAQAFWVGETVEPKTQLEQDETAARESWNRAGEFILKGLAKLAYGFMIGIGMAIGMWALR